MPKATETKTTTNLPIRRIPLDALRESEWNPRQYFPEPQMQELTESMRSSGFREWLPILVRPLPGFEELYEIGAGHRRSRAARQAGITEVPCIVREMTDEEFLDVLNFDNSGRQDVHPLHEAAGWQQWMEKTGKGVLDIAAKIGQSKEYVYQRLKYGSLCDEAKRAFLNNSITAGHAILIARLQPDDQDSALAFATGYQKPGVRQLAEFIRRDIHLQMDTACFDKMSEDLLPSAGSCEKCTKRTRNAPEMLLQIEHAADPNRDECTDPGCFNSKITAHIEVLELQYQAQGVKLLKISNAQLALRDSDYGKAQLERISDAPAPDLQPGIWMNGPRIGRLVYVKLFQPLASSPEEESEPEPARSQPTAAERRAEAERIRAQAQRNLEMQERAEEARTREEEKHRAKIEMERSVRRAVLDAISAKVNGVSRVDVEALVCDYLHNAEVNEEFVRLFGEEFDRPMPHAMIEKTVSKLGDADIYRMAVLIPVLDELDDFRLSSPAQQLLATAKRYKIDFGKIRLQVEAAAKQKNTPSKASAKKANPGKKKKVAAKPANTKKGGGKAK